MALGHDCARCRLPGYAVGNRIQHTDGDSRAAYSGRIDRPRARACFRDQSDGPVLVFLLRRLGRDLYHGSMNTWDWEPSVVIGCAALALSRLALARKRGWNRAPYFLAGVL